MIYIDFDKFFSEKPLKVIVKDELYITKYLNTNYLVFRLKNAGDFLIRDISDFSSLEDIMKTTVRDLFSRGTNTIKVHREYSCETAINLEDIEWY